MRYLTAVLQQGEFYRDAWLIGTGIIRLEEGPGERERRFAAEPYRAPIPFAAKARLAVHQARAGEVQTPEVVTGAMEQIGDIDLSFQIRTQ